MKGKDQSAFTLVELLVVIAIISLLMAMVIPGISNALGRARTTQTMVNLRNIGVGMYSFLEDHEWIYPVRFGDSLAYDRGVGGTRTHWQEQMNAYVGGNTRPGSTFNHARNPIWYSQNARRMGTQHFGLNHHMPRTPWNYQYYAIPNPGMIVIVGEINANASDFRPDLEPTFNGHTIARYRISNPGDIALYLHADGRVAALAGNQGEDVNRTMYRWW